MKNGIWLRIFVSVMTLGGVQSSVGMDISRSLAQFPRELQSHILALYNTDLDQDARVAQLVALREVCESWRSILTDNFIADIVGIPQQPDALKGALARAAREKHLNTMTLICRAHPSVDMRQALYEIIEKSKTGMFPDEELEILLDYGLNPNTTHVDSIDTSAVGGDFFITKDSLLVYVLGRCSGVFGYPTQENRSKAQKIFRRLLQQGADTASSYFNLLEYAANCRCIAEVGLLLTYPLNPLLTDYEEVCKSVCAGICCLHHHPEIRQASFIETIDELIKRGANPSYRERINACPNRCPNWEVVNELHQKVELNRNNIEVLNQEYTRPQLLQKELNEYNKKYWSYIEDADRAIGEINRITGSQHRLWSAGLKRPDTRNEVMRFISDLNGRLQRLYGQVFGATT